MGSFWVIWATPPDGTISQPVNVMKKYLAHTSVQKTKQKKIKIKNTHTKIY